MKKPGSNEAFIVLFIACVLTILYYLSYFPGSDSQQPDGLSFDRVRCIELCVNHYKLEIAKSDEDFEKTVKLCEKQFTSTTCTLVAK